MRRIVCLLLSAVLLCGCGSLGEENVEETEKEISNIYETKDIKILARDNVSFKIPELWEKKTEVKDDWTYYYFDESMFVLNITETKLDNDGFISTKDSFIDGMVEEDGNELISSEVSDISGQKVLEVEISEKVDGEYYFLKSINFVYNSEYYSLGWLIKKNSNIDYSKDYEEFKNGISILDHEETDENGYPTSWKMLSDLRNINKNISYIEVFGKDTDPNGTEMGSEGFYITKASFFDSRINSTSLNKYAGTMETFRTEEDCLKRAEYLRSLDEPDSGKLPTNQYIYQNGKVLFRVNKELSEIQAEEYNNQLIEIMNGYGGNESKENSQENEAEQPAQTTVPTIGQQNALKSAKEYLDISAFSYSELVSQLEYEQYTHEEAVYAVDNCGADWNEQAARSAKEYLDIMSFSREGLIEQLEFDGFTNEQAVYGVEQNGY